MFRASIAIAIAGLVRGAALDPMLLSMHTPVDCVHITKPGDHLLIGYKVTRENGDIIEPAFYRPNQLFHMVLENSDLSPVHKFLKGLCLNESKSLVWRNGADLNLSPLPVDSKNLMDLEENITLEFTVEHITEPDDYQIFGAWREGNISLVLDLINDHKGVNAVDEWGHTMLMIAVQKGNIEVVSSLLNTRMPKVDVNKAKSNGFTAVLYAVDLPSTSILKALLRRGGDPNCQLYLTGRNTPLHLAAMFEKTKHAELLLEFGANPMILNEFGQNPLQVLPRDAVRSTKLYFKKMFEDAFTKLNAERDAGNLNSRKEISRDL